MSSSINDTGGAHHLSTSSSPVPLPVSPTDAAKSKSPVSGSGAVRKRPIRASRACDNCRRRKVKCSEGAVCAECLRFGEECIYREFYRPRKDKKSCIPSSPAPSLPPPPSTVYNPSSHLTLSGSSPISLSSTTAATASSMQRDIMGTGTPGVDIFRQSHQVERFPMGYYSSPSQPFPTRQGYFNSSLAGPSALPVAPPGGPPPLPPSSTRQQHTVPYFRSPISHNPSQVHHPLPSSSDAPLPSSQPIVVTPSHSTVSHSSNVPVQSKQQHHAILQSQSHKHTNLPITPSAGSEIHSITNNDSPATLTTTTKTNIHTNKNENRHLDLLSDTSATLSRQVCQKLSPMLRSPISADAATSEQIGSGCSSPSVNTPRTPTGATSSTNNQEKLTEEKMLQAMSSYGNIFNYFAVGLDSEDLSKKAKKLWRSKGSILTSPVTEPQDAELSPEDALERGLIYSIIALGFKGSHRHSTWAETYTEKAGESLTVALSSPPSNASLLYFFHQTLLHLVAGNFTAAYMYAGINAKIALLLPGVNLMGNQNLLSSQCRILRFARSLEQYTSIRAGQQSSFASDLDKLFDRPSASSSIGGSSSRALNSGWFLNFSSNEELSPAIGHSVLNQQLIALASHTLRDVYSRTWDFLMESSSRESKSKQSIPSKLSAAASSSLKPSASATSPSTLLVQSYTMVFETSRDMLAISRNPQDYNIPIRNRTPEAVLMTRVFHLHLCCFMFRPYVLMLWGLENGQYTPPSDVKDTILNGAFRCIQNSLDLINLMMETNEASIRSKRVYYFQPAIAVLVIYTLFYNRQNAEALRLDIASVTSGLERAEKYIPHDKLKCANPFLQFAMPINSEETLLLQWQKSLHIVA